MLSFLRKIRRSLIESSNTKKYLLYAIGEVLLVMIGILLALQVNNWNEDVKERKKEHKILTELAKNLETNVQRLEANIQRGQIDNQFSNVILSAINNRNLYADTLDQYFPLALNAVDEGTFISFVGYESLKNAGFEIIKDDRLRNEIITLFESQYRDLRARYDRIEWHSSELRNFKEQQFYSNRTAGARAYTPFDFVQLMKEKRLYGWLMKLSGYRVWIEELLIISRDETQEVLQLINNAISENGHKTPSPT